MQAGTVLEEWGCWTALEPDSGKSETINGVNIYEVEFESTGAQKHNLPKILNK
jgi:hypothetical protein